MKFTIRRGVFETNSSSSHSMCIQNNAIEDCMDTEHIINDLLNGRGAWKIKDNSYGRSPFRFLNKFSEKVLYAVAIYGYDLERVKDPTPEGFEAASKIVEIEHIVRKYVPEFSSFDVSSSDSYYKFGYAENTGFDVWLKNNNITLEEFLVSNKYAVVIDGDEYNIFTDMIKCGIIREDIKIYTSWDG